MIAFEDAQARLLRLSAPVTVETVSLARAAGRWTAEAVYARRDQPVSALSAMDGYAIRHCDLPGPWRVSGSASAGLPSPSPLVGGTAARIFTGASLPEGADTVVMQEHMQCWGDELRLLEVGSPPAHGQNVRVRASDFMAGAALIAAGERLTPARIALAAMGGYGELPVRRRVRIALLSTGNELVQPGADPGPNRIPASNAPMIAAQLAHLPADVIDFGIIADDLVTLTEALVGAGDFDIVITSGGASVGDHDLVRPALIAASADIDFWKIAMRPGKPLMAGRLHKAVALGLPGNPVSAFVTAALFAVPLVAHMGGAQNPLPLQIAARLGGSLPAVGTRTDFVRAYWADGRLVPVVPNDSAGLAALSTADALIVRRAGSPAAFRGDDVQAVLIA